MEPMGVWWYGWPSGKESAVSFSKAVPYGTLS